jgi:hypothetical protein
MNKLIVRVEEGSLYYEGHEGDWLSDGLLDYLTSAFEAELAALDMEPNADAAIEASKVDPSRVFLVTINDPGYASDGLGWEGPVTVKEIA